jgi:Peptidase MA superfamily
MRDILGRLAAAAILAGAALLPLAGPALAAGPAMPRPTVEVRFLDRIHFTGSATLTADVRRVEIVIDVEGSTRSIVAEIPSTGSTGTTQLAFDFDTPSGSIYPNTDMTVHYRATLDDGSSIDGPPLTVHYDDTRLDWHSLAGDFVTVHWTQGGTTFGRRALQIADDAVRRVSDLLGVTERDPIDFYVYADNTDFYDVIGPGARENVGGEAHPDIRTLFAQISPGAVDDPWVGVVIPHELTHLVFDTAARNPYHYPPRWLNEGIAVYLSEGYSASDRSAVGRAVDGASLMPLRALAGQFPTTADQFFLAYAESVSAVDFLVRTYGQPAMVTLVRTYGDGVTDDEAFRAALGLDVAGFESAWLDSLGAAAPSPFGPVDAPPGPLPSDWVGSPANPGPIASGAAETPGSPAATTAPGPAGGGGVDQATAILGAVIIALIVTAGVAVWLMRRDRPVAAPDPESADGGDDPT